MTDATDDLPQTTPRWLRVLPSLTTFVGSALAAVFALQLWNAHLGIPFQYGGDSLSHAMHLEQLVQNGWIWDDDRLGAPFGQQMQDWPIGDVLSLITGWVIALFTSNWAVVQNGVFLLSFPLTALSAWWALQKLGVSSWTSSVLGILFSVLPYHFVRGESHLFLSNYYVVPLGVYLAMRLFDSDSLFATGSRFSSRWAKYLSWRTVQTLGIAFLIALGGIYYAAFTVIFVAVALVVRLIRKQSIMAPLVILAVIVGGVVLATAPTILFHIEHGANTKAAVRNAFESEVYGLKLAQMLAPASGHRIDAFDEYQQRYLDEFPLPSERGSAALGVVASAGLLGMIGLALASLLRSGVMSVAELRMRQFSLIALVGFFVAAVGGFSSIIGMLLFGDIRSWNRMSIFIAICALAVVGFALDSVFARVRVRALLVKTVVLSAVLIIGFFDQVTPKWTPAYATVDARFLGDQKYFDTIENNLGNNASVYFLPRVEFPESPKVNGVDANDPLVPYLQTESLKWSFGGIKGRLASSWQERVRTKPADMLVDLVAAGFQGVLIDRNGYVDRAAGLEAEISKVLGKSPLVNEFEDYAFFDLRSFGRELQERNSNLVNERKEALLYPVGVVNAIHFFFAESDEESTWRWANGGHGILVVENTTKTSMRSRIFVELQTAVDTPSQFLVTWPDGSSQKVDANAGPVVVSHVQDLSPGSSRVDIRSSAQPLPSGIDTRDLRFKLLRSDVTKEG